MSGKEESVSAPPEKLLKRVAGVSLVLAVASGVIGILLDSVDFIVLCGIAGAIALAATIIETAIRPRTTASARGDGNAARAFARDDAIRAAREAYEAATSFRFSIGSGLDTAQSSLAGGASEVEDAVRRAERCRDSALRIGVTDVSEHVAVSIGFARNIALRMRRAEAVLASAVANESGHAEALTLAVHVLAGGGPIIDDEEDLDLVGGCC